MLREMGEWLEVNGAAVDGSRPWKVHYQGNEPHFYAGGKAFSKTYADYAPDDFRFTQSKEGHTLYVFAMGEFTGDVVIETLSWDEMDTVTSAKLLGGTKVVPLGKSDNGNVVLPAGELIAAGPARLKGPRVFAITGIE